MFSNHLDNTPINTGNCYRKLIRQSYLILLNDIIMYYNNIILDSINHKFFLINNILLNNIDIKMHYMQDTFVFRKLIYKRVEIITYFLTNRDLLCSENFNYCSQIALQNERLKMVLEFVHGKSFIFTEIPYLSPTFVFVFNLKTAFFILFIFTIFIKIFFNFNNCLFYYYRYQMTTQTRCF